jgi:Uma2 family endonuclease
MTTPTLPNSPLPPTQRYHWTVEAFYRATSAGVFDDPKRWEVIRGELWRRDIVNPPHAYTTEYLAESFRRCFAPDYRVREEKPLRLSEDTEPQPDVVVVLPDKELYAHRHPTPMETRLVVEVADATRYVDLGEKAALYAEAGIPEYWVVDLPRRRLVVHRDPSVDGWGEVRRLSEEDEIAPLFAPTNAFPIVNILPPKVENNE